VVFQESCKCGNNVHLNKSDKKNYIIDIDGVLCNDICNCSPHRMLDAIPNRDVISKINDWYSDGHIITFFTARTDEHELVTRNWLVKNGVKYHGVIFNKPRGGNYHYIDDKNIRATRYYNKFGDFIKVNKEIEVFE